MGLGVHVIHLEKDYFTRSFGIKSIELKAGRPTEGEGEKKTPPKRGL
jgi:hypothetical protein